MFDRLTNRYWTGLLAALCAVSLVRAQDAPAANHRQDSANDLSVVMGKTVLLDCTNQVERVAVGLGGVAEAVAVSPVEILVNGKAPGETSLILWEKGGNREFFNVVVRAGAVASSDHLEVIRRELSHELPGQPLKVTADNGAVFLSGTVKDLTSSERAVQIASVGGKVVNLLNVEVPAADPQVLLKVVFASVDRSRSKSLGVNLFSTGYGDVIGGASTGQFSPPSLSIPSAASGATASLSNALIVALIALACTAGMKALATAINTGFTNLGTTLTSSF